MSSFPGSPRLRKGAIMLVDPESGAGLARHRPSLQPRNFCHERT
jgi:hypothetical protein